MRDQLVEWHVTVERAKEAIETIEKVQEAFLVQDGIFHTLVVETEMPALYRYTGRGQSPYSCFTLQ